MRIAIIGNSGSGKSTLSQAIARERDWPVLDLDTVAWELQKVAVPRDDTAARSDVERFCASHPDWILEGCYSDLIAASLRHAPVLIFLDPGLEQCLANCRQRPFESHKFRSKVEQDEKLDFLLAWVSEYYSREGTMSWRAHEALFTSYSGPKRWLRELPPPDSTLLTELASL